MHPEHRKRIVEQEPGRLGAESLPTVRWIANSDTELGGAVRVREIPDVDDPDGAQLGQRVDGEADPVVPFAAQERLPEAGDRFRRPRAGRRYDVVLMDCVAEDFVRPAIRVLADVGEQDAEGDPGRTGRDPGR